MADYRAREWSRSARTRGMQCKYRIITVVQPSDGVVTLMLDGTFGEEAIAELEESISQARGAQREVYLDLSEVTLVDRKTVAYFSEQAEAHVKLVNCPVYLRPWIVGEGQTDEA